jgi:hypothetical protein
MTQAAAKRFSVDQAPFPYAGDELEAIKASFADNGYVVLRNVVSGEQLSVLGSRIVTEYRRQKMSGALFSGGGGISGHLNCFPGQESRTVYDELHERGVLDLIKTLFPKVVRLPNVGCNLNLPGSAAQHFHMDSNYFTEDFLICNVAVVDTDLENGAIEVIPGTHKKFYKFWRFAVERPDRRRIRIPMKRGDVLIRTSNLWHRGMPNRSARPRPMVAFTWEDGGSLRESAFGIDGGKIQFFPNWYSPNLVGRLRERTFVAVPATYSAYRFVRSLFGNKKNYSR